MGDEKLAACELAACELAACEEDELVIRAQQSDDEAFTELMRRTSGSSLRLAMSILRDREQAEDELQNSYLSAWRHVAQFHREGRFSSWMSRIVANHCLMRLRTARSSRFVFLDDPGPDESAQPMELADKGTTPEASLCGKELSDRLRSEIGKLPPVLKRVLILRDMEELSTADAANRLGITPAAVKSRLLRARVELRKRLERFYGDAGPAAIGV